VQKGKVWRGRVEREREGERRGEGGSTEGVEREVV